MPQLEGKVARITGGAGGIARAARKLFCGRGGTCYSSLSYSNIAHLTLGADTTNPRDEAAYHGSAMENKYFGWEDAPGKTPNELANLFIERLPRVAELSLTRDWGYAGWFNELLGKIENGWIPVCYYVATGHNVEGVELNRHSAFGNGDEIFPWPPSPPLCGKDGI